MASCYLSLIRKIRAVLVAVAHQGRVETGEVVGTSEQPQLFAVDGVGAVDPARHVRALVNWRVENIEAGHGASCLLT